MAVITNPEITKKTSTPTNPPEKPSSAWDRTTSRTATARSPWISARCPRDAVPPVVTGGRLFGASRRRISRRSVAGGARVATLRSDLRHVDHETLIALLSQVHAGDNHRPARAGHRRAPPRRAGRADPRRHDDVPDPLRVRQNHD